MAKHINTLHSVSIKLYPNMKYVSDSFMLTMYVFNDVPKAE